MDWRGVAGCLLSTSLVMTLAACGSSEKIGGTEGNSGRLFNLSVNGVGPLNASIPFNLVRIGSAFQDLNVAEETRFTEGEKYPVITIKQQARPLLSINPDYQQQGIFSIIVHDNLVGNELGHELGDKYNEIYDNDRVEECAAGLEEWSGKVMCYAPKASNILYLFEDEASSLADNAVPEPAAMAEWQLAAIVWKTPRR